MSDKIQVVLVDDHPLFRAGVAHTLASEADIDVIGQGASADEAVRLAQELLPDVILLDINMPGGGLNAARTISATSPVARIAMLTVSEEEEDLLAALKAGARGYILKGVPAREIVRIIRALCSGESYVTPTLAASLLREMTGVAPGARPPVDPLNDLTDREREILEGVAEGKSNKEIGAQLHLSEKTVKHYMTNILQKLQVRNRVEAALMAQRGARGDSRT
jgi:two-component system, NarL family, nitrate/nitrite response regulator NarL